MSLLLDALKKSEAQRRRGNTPSLDLSATPPSSSPGRRPGVRGLVAAAAVVAVAAAAMWLWPVLSTLMDSDPVSDGDAARVAAASPERTDAGSGTPAGESARAGARDPVPETGADSESAAAPAEAASGPAPSPESPSAAEDSTPQQDQSSQPQPATPEESEAENEASGGNGAGSRESGGDEPAAADSGEPEPARAGESMDNFIRPWELPQAMRAAFPELNLTVHFYAAEPGDRFVLINGERYGEGDSLGDGVSVDEIHRRGVVVKFRDYRVLVE